MSEQYEYEREVYREAAEALAPVGRPDPQNDAQVLNRAEPALTDHYLRTELGL